MFKASLAATKSGVFRDCIIPQALYCFDLDLHLRMSKNLQKIIGFGNH